MQDKTHLLPALLSALIPGLGQLVKGHLLKALIFWVAVSISYWAFGWTWLLFGIYAFVWLVNVLDAAFSNADPN